MEQIKQLILPTTLDRWKTQNLDYNWYFALTIAGGFFGLDYLYLGSPIGAIVKFIFNIFTLGYWWYFDALNATVSQDQIRLYGPSAPVIGATGLAAGRFRDAKRELPPTDQLNKHLNFMIYGLVIATLGIFGGDSFLTGNFFNGAIRLFSFISIIGIPIAMLWFVSNAYYYLLDTSSALDQNWLFFGAPKPADESAECPSVLMVFTVWALETSLTVMEFIPILSTFVPFLRTFIERLRDAYGMTVKVVKATVKELIVAKTKGEQLLAQEQGKPLPTAQELQVKIAEQKGGAFDDSNPLAAILLFGTIGFILVSSIVVSLRRQRQNAAEPKSTDSAKSKAAKQHGGEATDEPPEPGIPRGPTPSV